MVDDLGDIPGYRGVIAGQYDGVYGALTPEAARARHAGVAPYLSRVMAALDLPDEGYHLDLGCGDGLCALAVARARPEMVVVGVDASEKALALARTLAAQDGLKNAHFVHGDAETPPEGQFERVSALSLFDLMPDKRAALATWRERATPQGKLVITDGFAMRTPGTHGAGAISQDGLVQLARVTGWRLVHREDLTPLVKRLDAEKAWLWPEYVRDGFSYGLVVLEAHREPGKGGGAGASASAPPSSAPSSP